MTIQDLKNSRADIIEFIEAMGYDLKFAMHIAAEYCSMCDTIQEVKDEIQSHCKPVREGKIARLSAEYHESRDERYNSNTKSFERI